MVFEVILGGDPFLTTLSQFVTTDNHSHKEVQPAAKKHHRENSHSTTAVDVQECPNAFIFVADLPGLKAGEIKVQIENDNILTILGERKREELSEDEKFLRLERPAGRFLRKFTLPGNAKLDEISAASTDGVLTVSVPKLPPPQPQQPKTITVTDG